MIILHSLMHTGLIQQFIIRANEVINYLRLNVIAVCNDRS